MCLTTNTNIASLHKAGSNSFLPIFRDLMPYVKPEKMFFNKEMFLESVPDKDRSFYEQVVTHFYFTKNICTFYVVY